MPSYIGRHNMRRIIPTLFAAALLSALTLTATQPADAYNPGGTQTDCAASPHACGYPDATNSGARGGTYVNIPADATSGPGWTWHGGSEQAVHIDGDGTVFANYNVAGTVEVYGQNVTVRHNQITADGDGWGVGLRHADNAIVQRNTIHGVDNGSNLLSVAVKDIYGDATSPQILGNNIYYTTTGVQIGNGLIRNNYIHDMGFTGDYHLNGVSVGGGDTSPLLIQHNTILNDHDQTDAIALFQDFGPESNKTIAGNLLGGGSYTLYGGGPNGCTTPGQPKCDPSDHIVVKNNRFSRIYFPNGGTFGPVANFNSRGVGNVFTGNVWDDTLAPVNP